MKTAKLALLPGLLLLLVAYAGAQSPGKAASTGTSLPVAAAAPGPAVPAPNPMPSHSNTTQAAAGAGRLQRAAPSPLAPDRNYFRRSDLGRSCDPCLSAQQLRALLRVSGTLILLRGPEGRAEAPLPARTAAPLLPLRPSRRLQASRILRLAVNCKL